jgi:hypothetical protein
MIRRIRRRNYNESAARVGTNHWEDLANYISDKLDCNVDMSDFGWMQFNVDLGDGSYTDVELYVEWNIRRNKCVVKCYMPDVSETPFTCATVSSQNFAISSFEDIVEVIERKLFGI